LKLELERLNAGDCYLLKVDGVVCKKITNAADASAKFLSFLFRMVVFQVIKEGYREDEEVENIDAEEELDKMIREGVWDWRNEVLERNMMENYYDEIDFDAEQCKREFEYLLRKDGWGYYE